MEFLKDKEFVLMSYGSREWYSQSCWNQGLGFNIKVQPRRGHGGGVCVLNKQCWCENMWYQKILNIWMPRSNSEG